MRILFILLLFFTLTVNAKAFEELKDGPILIAHAGQHQNIFSIGKDKKSNTVKDINALFPYINAWYTDDLIPGDL